MGTESVTKTTHCIEQVFSTTPGSFKTKQCNKPAGHGDGGQFCTEHGRSNKDIGPTNDKRKAKDRLWR